jgi:hypothetical protein
MKRIFTLLFSVTLSVAAFAQVGLKINEIDYDQIGTDTAEFLEIYNADANAIDLGNYTIILINGNTANPGPYDTISLPTHTLNPGSFYVICGSGGFVPNCDLVLPASSNIIQNGGSSATPASDAIAIIDNSSQSIIDVVSYEGTTTGWVEGSGIPVDQSDTTVSTPMLGTSRFPDGADSNDNSVDFHNACSTPGAANANVNTNCSTGLSEKTLVNTIRVYPNPSKGISTIDCRGLSNAKITVKNVIGNEIKSVVLKNSESSFQCDLSEYPNGVYFVQIKADGAEYTQRIILKK